MSSPNLTVSPPDQANAIHASFLTCSGNLYHLQAPQHSLLSIEDIAHALAHQCRFGGHSKQFYSYAQHAVLVSRLLAPADALAGLLYDGPKALIGNVQTAAKVLLPDYVALEERLRTAIFARFGLPDGVPAAVHGAALTVRATEHRDVLAPHGREWPELRGIAPTHDRIVPLAPAAARDAFLARFAELRPARAQRLAA